MKIGERIKEQRLKIGMSQVDFASNIGVTKQTLYKYETGLITNIPSDKVEAISKFTGISPAYYMGWTDDINFTRTYDNIKPINAKKYPLLGSIACGKPIFCNEERESYVVSGTEVDADFCLVCNGDSMIGARINDGDIVFIKKHEMVNNGEIAAVVINDEATLKRVYYHEEENIITLSAENPKYAPLIYKGYELQNIYILGKAVAFQSDVY